MEFTPVEPGSVTTEAINANESYVKGLRYELSGAVQSGDKAHEKAVKAELDRASGKKVEKAVLPKSTETRSK